jgi:hypothetical protein
MKKEIILFTLFITIFCSLIIPFISYEVTINKSTIVENRPFAGVLNGHTVGTSLCVNYAFNYKEMPVEKTYIIKISPIGWILGIPHQIQ